MIMDMHISVFVWLCTSQCHNYINQDESDSAMKATNSVAYQCIFSLTPCSRAMFKLKEFYIAVILSALHQV